jgi:multiple sugar transport system permease protein
VAERVQPPAVGAALPATRERRVPVGHVKQAVFVVLLLGLSVLFVYPFLWLVSASFKPQSQVFDNRLVPAKWVWNYCCTGNTDVLDVAPVFTWFLNSVWISGLGAVAVTFSSALIAFAFAYFRFPLRNVLFGLLLATLMLPAATMMIPRFLIWNELGLVNTQYPLWVPNLFGSAFYVFLQRQFFLGIPREYFEAARMDGDNYWTMFWRIAVPLAKPALIVTFIFEIQAKWFDLMDPLIYLRDAEKFTLPLGIKTVLDQFGQGGGGEGDWQLIMAATVILTVPMIVIFAIFQRYFIHGIATQGRKG